jgi:hypothetical protein
MVGPARKREAVTHVQDRLKTSERRACSSLGQPRSTQRYEGSRRNADAGLIKAMRRIAQRETRAGYRSAQAHGGSSTICPARSIRMHPMAVLWRPSAGPPQQNLSVKLLKLSFVKDSKTYQSCGRYQTKCILADRPRLLCLAGLDGDSIAC